MIGIVEFSFVVTFAICRVLRWLVVRGIERLESEE
jgi:hypothetical protein